MICTANRNVVRLRKIYQRYGEVKARMVVVKDLVIRYEPNRQCIAIADDRA